MYCSYRLYDKRLYILFNFRTAYIYAPFFWRVLAGTKRMAFSSNPHPCNSCATCRWFIFDPSSKLKKRSKVRPTMQMSKSFYYNRIFFARINTITITQIKKKKQSLDHNQYSLNIFTELYHCPCYYYPQRSGDQTRSAFVVAIDLKAGPQGPDFWVKRGTALLLSLAV